MIKALILDVDGVIVGDQPGVNFPLPHTQIIDKFKEIHAKGMPIILCTAKFGQAFTIQEIIKQANLSNPHITDGGALIIDPVDNVVIKKHVMDPKAVQECLGLCLQKDIFAEAYTSEAFYIEKQQATRFSDFLERRLKVLQKDAVAIDSLTEEAARQEIIKILAFTKKADESAMRKIIQRLGASVNVIWTQNPYLHPLRPVVITALGVSKAQAATEALANLGIAFDEVLGVGDSASDWNFMEHCGYAATLANGDDRIKQLVRTKDEDRRFIAPHVNENGILDILKHFSLV